MCVFLCTSHNIHMEVRRQPMGVGSLLQSCGPIRLGSGHLYSLRHLPALMSLVWFLFFCLECPFISCTEPPESQFSSYLLQETSCGL